jgi:hypothetical protein
MVHHWSISPTFYERICANIHAQKQLTLKMKAQKSFAQNFRMKNRHVKCW